MIRSIVRYGNRTLHNPSEDVPEITPAIQTLITDMVETMHAESGVGLAAPQIGIPFRIFVADPSGGHDENQLVVMVNPEWIEQRGTQREDEGCLSLPGFSAPVP